MIHLFEEALKNSINLQKDQIKTVAPGVQVHGYGFEKLVSTLMQNRTLYLLEPKGENIRTTRLENNPVFILSDHLVMPKKTMIGLKRHGLKTISLGKQKLFASQCIVLINHELDLGLHS